MAQLRYLWLLALGTGAVLAGEDVVFHSGVALVRVDAQVIGRDNRPIPGLHPEDFVLREDGHSQQVRNFARENTPLDVLLLFDVSTSMRPHVERIASAAHQALQVLDPADRVAIMVFDRESRVRMSFRRSRDGVDREFDTLLHEETFDGGTDITQALIEAAQYIGREGRTDARRAIVILTDDQTELRRDETHVERELVKADAVLSALIAPFTGFGRHNGNWGRGGYGRRGGRGGYSGTRSAGTTEIAHQSGGDSMSVNNASALETTLTRLRERYALHFHLPPDVKPGQEMAIDVALSEAALLRYPGAEVRFRRVYLAPAIGPTRMSEPAEVVAKRPLPAQPSSDTHGRRRAVDGPIVQGPSIGTASGGSEPGKAPPQTGGWRQVVDTSTPPTRPPPPPAIPSLGGWRKATPEEQQQASKP